jgi:hypothetical protein
MNYTKLKIASVCVICLCSASILQAKDWRGIVPLKSTRTDVEKLLGQPNGLGRYQFENERAYINYSSGCARMDDCICLVPKDTVIYIFVTLESDLKFSDLKIDRPKYHKTKSTHLPGIVTYANDDEGIIYTVDDEDDEVTDITYLYTTRDCQSLIKDRPPNKRRSSRLRRRVNCLWPDAYAYDGKAEFRVSKSAGYPSDDARSGQDSRGIGPNATKRRLWGVCRRID